MERGSGAMGPRPAMGRRSDGAFRRPMPTATHAGEQAAATRTTARSETMSRVDAGASGDASRYRSGESLRRSGAGTLRPREGAWMLDRLISGAGAVTDGADRSVRAAGRRVARGFATTRPGSLAGGRRPAASWPGCSSLAGLEATDPSTPVTLAPADVAASTALGEPDLLHDPRCALVDLRRVLQRRQRERHRGRGRGRPSSGITGSSTAMPGPASPCARRGPRRRSSRSAGPGS